MEKSVAKRDVNTVVKVTPVVLLMVLGCRWEVGGDGESQMNSCRSNRFVRCRKTIGHE